MSFQPPDDVARSLDKVLFPMGRVPNPNDRYNRPPYQQPTPAGPPPMNGPPPPPPMHWQPGDKMPPSVLRPNFGGPPPQSPRMKQYDLLIPSKRQPQRPAYGALSGLMG